MATGPAKLVLRSLGLLLPMVAIAATLGLAGADGPRQVDDGPHGGDRSGGADGRALGGPVSYDRDIRPLLSDRCFLCHGQDAAKRHAELRLDDPESAFGPRDGGPAIVPGAPERSQLWARITSHDPDEVMPPSRANRRPFTPAELELIRRWIADGARYQPHWSFIPPVKAAPPQVKLASWPRGEIDRFILRGLEEAGIEPSPEADRATLLRRMFLDITGLPPTVEELDAFLADARPDAYEAWVDRLVTLEPYLTRYAERMASPWLDQARYGDTSGIHHDQGRLIWPWRDWVLNAYRANLPFDRFVIEQLAGDLLPAPTQDQIVATGFNRNHVTSDEGGAIEEEYLFEYAADRTATTGSVFLGLTLGCARCHDHKYDPVTAADFYSMLAFYNSIDEKGVDIQLPRNPRYAFPPSIVAPGPGDLAAIARLKQEVAAASAELDQVAAQAGEQAQLDGFPASLQDELGVRWAAAELVSATSEHAGPLALQEDGSALATGVNPRSETYTLRLRLGPTPDGVNLIQLEGLTDASVGGKVGRSDNGNVVVTGLTILAPPEAPGGGGGGGGPPAPVALAWAWADVEQSDRGFRVTNLLVGDPLGWAVDGHNRPGPRAAMFLAAKPFGAAGGEVRVTIEHRSEYAQHAFVRPRVRLGSIAAAGLARLPVAATNWYTAGPFPAATDRPVFGQSFPPEAVERLDLTASFPGDRRWRYESRITDGGSLVGLSNTVGSLYLARTLFAPSARAARSTFGTDDGVRVLLSGREVFARDTSRGLTPDEESLALDLPAGPATVVFKVVNTGGPDGFQHRDRRVETSVSLSEGVLTQDLLPALRPIDTLPAPQLAALRRAWLMQVSPSCREAAKAVVAAEACLAKAEAELPQTMVMKELSRPRPTFVMKRGQYDQPDKDSPVARAIPAFLGALAHDSAGQPNRLTLARWIVSDANPLLARVTVNRLWGLFFGQAIVRTTEDFGLQGEWPSHPELLDWLAVDFRERGWDVRRLVRQIVTSAAYRQASRVRPDVIERDPDNRLLAFFPRQRLSAEGIRDQALLLAGLLVEKLGGPSVKPYQPAGVWEEVSMPDANTREFVRGTGEDLWRRSLYTYWKRASPPPAMLTFDAPTREFCVVRRLTTNTPLQALVLWNDEQHVEAARALAARAIAFSPGSPPAPARDDPDPPRLTWLYRSALGREPSLAALDGLRRALADFRARYRAAPDDARKLISVGESKRPAEVDPVELAAWTMVCSAILSSDGVIVKH